MPRGLGPPADRKSAALEIPVPLTRLSLPGGQLVGESEFEATSGQAGGERDEASRAMSPSPSDSVLSPWA